MQVRSDEPPWFFTHVFPWGFIVAGAGYAWEALKVIIQAQASHRWPTVEGRVTLSQLEEWDVGEGPARLHAPKLEYTYVVGGRTFKGVRVTSADTEGGSREEALAMLKQLPLGKKVTVLYCPADPGTAWLRPGIRPRQVFKLFFALLTLGLGIAMLYLSPLLRYFELGDPTG